MKYLQQGGFEQNPLMRLTLGLSLLMLAGFWVTNLALYFNHMTLDPASVVTYYRGDESEFIPARSAAGMLEITHMHLPMFALVLLLLTHLLIFAPMKDRTKVAFIVVAFASALLSEGAGWMTRFLHPGFAWLKVSGFLMFQASLAYLIVGMGVYLATAPSVGGRKRARRLRSVRARARRGTEPSDDPKDEPSS